MVEQDGEEVDEFLEKKRDEEHGFRFLHGVRRLKMIYFDQCMLHIYKELLMKKMGMQLIR